MILPNRQNCGHILIVGSWSGFGTRTTTHGSGHLSLNTELCAKKIGLVVSCRLVENFSHKL